METSKNKLLNEVIPFRATAPTEVIKDEIKAREMSKKEFALRMGMQPSNLTRLLKGERITIQIAAKLEEALDIPAEFWVTLQTKYDKDIKAIAMRDDREKEATIVERMLSTIVDLPAIYKGLKINSSNFIQRKLEILENEMQMNPLGLKDMDFIKNLCYKKSDKLNYDEKAQNAWLTLAYISSLKNKPSKTYEVGNGVKAAKEIASATHHGEITEQQIKDILEQNGISYSVVPKVEKTHIDAVSFYVNSDYPAIITTHRYNDMSMLIFNVLHELGHIEKHINSTGKVYISSDETYSMNNKEEHEANSFAEDILIEPDLWKEMMQSEIKGISSKNIVKKLRTLSTENQLNFNIVAWRYKFESHNYGLFGVKPIHIR